MNIFKEQDKNSKNNYTKVQEYLKRRLKKRVLFKVLFSLFFGVIIFTPLDYLNTNTSGRPIDKFRMYLLATIGKLDKRAQFIATESLDFGDSLYNVGLNYIRSVFVNEDILNINISFKNFKKLQIKRDQAVKDGILVRSSDDKVNATIEYKGKSYPVKLRLKGDWTDHLIGDKWSFRVESRKGKSLLGMNELSLQHPRTRNYLNEFIFHNLLKYESLPYLRYKFLPIAINGKHLGVYALEEHFSKELLENSGFREGPIIKISDQNLRGETQRKKIIKYESPINTVDVNNSEILTFNIDKTVQNEAKISQFRLSKNLLDQILKREAKTSEVFDLKLTAKYFALCDLLGAASAQTWHDMRFYFNPISSRLVPIGYDAQPAIRNRNKHLSFDLNVMGLFDDKIFLKEYLKELHRISKTKYLDEFLNEISSDIKKQIAVINKTFPHVNFLKEELYKNQKYIKNRLNPLDPISLSFAEQVKDYEKLKIKLFNKSLFPIQVHSLVYENKTYYPSLKKSLDPRKKFKRFNYTETEFIHKKSQLLNNNITKENEVIVKYSLDGINNFFTTETTIIPWAESTKSSNRLIAREPNHLSFPSLIIDNSNRLITIKDDFVVKKPLIFPIDYRILIEAGTNISLNNSGMFLVQGPLIIEGTEDKPVYISSEKNAMGILVLNSKFRSNLKNVVFNNLNAPSVASLNITGGLTFYNSPVDISYSRFINSKSEDAINIIRSTFSIKNSYFENSFSDAIDIDFSEGSIENNQFFKIGNDAIDISGSLVTLNKINIDSAIDKAISVGENSNVIGNNLNISRAFIGIASKDLSSIKINNSNINNTEICLAAYQKKSEYGPGSIMLFEKNKICQPFNYILEDGSTINSDSQGLTPNTFNAYKKLYPSEK
ncbi:hypothetical protein EU94_0372 [Prochlorococcus marinus str. MIT 9123]|uniref:CotH kinase family protein n=1 Tax=Prochlorococcus TaxID=1218 RepID=UPI00051785B7|nr:CotH kinase family protein [Prochlorococcus marinus]KGF95074.1 hypothetical protein EU94_0372 [Prochlorococcus marinus str. MIT 9123]